jgi:hypothetical protein
VPGVKNRYLLVSGGAVMEEKTKSKALGWECHTHCMGFDWVKNHHQIVVIDRDG